jgi:hypothetical protein
MVTFIVISALVLLHLSFVCCTCEERALPKTVDEFQLQLILLEDHFGGLQNGNVPCDHLSKIEGWTGSLKCTGGDRMTDKPPSHNYAPTYANQLFRYQENMNVIAEVGILTGSGLAIWSALYPKAQIHGFDMFLNNTLSNMAFLKSRGAFCTENLHLHEMNQMEPMNTVMKLSVKFDVVIDDGYHDDKASWNTWEVFEPHLSDDGVYIIEDCECTDLRNRMTTSYPQYRVHFRTTSTVRRGSFLIVIRKRRSNVIESNH